MHTFRFSRLASILLLLLAASLLAVGCGGDNGDDGGGGGNSTAEDESSEDDGGEEPDDDGGDESDDDGGDESDDDVAAREDKYDAAPSEKLDPKKSYTVKVTTSEGSFDIALDQKAGPIAAANFAFLVKEGFYDGIIFHRIIKDFMVQTGDPAGTGTGGPGYAIKDDKITGSYERGTVAMANAGPDTGGSQFFIVQGTTVDQTLGKDYAIFGKVDEAGMKIVDTIANVEVEAGSDGAVSSPVETVRIEKMELEES